jgi:hypothetical protein
MPSPAYGRGVCYAGTYTFGEEVRATFLRSLRAHEIEDLEGRPRRGKRFVLTREEARKLYPMYGGFDQILV